MKTLTKILSGAAIGLASLFSPVKVSGQEITVEDFHIAQKQPNDRSLIWYGSGDVDSSGEVDSLDLLAMQNGVQNPMGDVDGDGVYSTPADQDTLQLYLSGQRDYLPGMANQMQTPEEKESWFGKILYNIDQTDTITYNNTGDPKTRKVSGTNSTQLCLNALGHEALGLEIPDKYDLIDVPYNLPFYLVNLVTSTGGHGMIAYLVGDDPSKFDHWRWAQSQEDRDVIIKGPPAWESSIYVYSPTGFNRSSDPDMLIDGLVALFNINNAGKDTLIYIHENVKLQRPEYISRLPDALPPELSISSPIQDSTYHDNVSSLEYLVSDVNPGDRIEYSLDGGMTRTSVPWGSSIINLQSQQGKNNWIVYAADSLGHVSSDTVSFNVDTVTTGIEDIILPIVYKLNQNYPNPFNPSTTIEYSLPESGFVSLTVFNLHGRTVRILERDFKSAGSYTIDFNAAGLSSGLYFLKMEAGDFRATSKMMLLK